MLVVSESNDNPADDTTRRNDELVAAIRAALTAEASAEARTSAAHACRAILRGLEPALRNGAPSAAPASVLAGTPLGNALGAISSIPREQVLEFLVTGVRALLGQGVPTYRTAPAPPRVPHTDERTG
jgi:hypothetical protein